jgi:hypothetical protein
MNTYKISCFSKCGSYFASYLQSVTVNADSEEEALTLCKEWLDENQRKFIYPESEWRIRELDDAKGVIDYLEDSDY